MPSFTDQTGRTIALQQLPRRIVSLVPSQTELLYYLGLEQVVIGITKFCIHPDEWFRSKIRVGGTKTIKMDIIHQLQPDLIIANKEENVKEQIDELANQYPVWVSDVNDLNQAYDMIDSIGELTGTKEKSFELIANIRSNFAMLPSRQAKGSARRAPDSFGGVRTAYLIWKNPYMTVGGDTFINDMLQRCGFKNIFSDKNRYPSIDIEQLQTANCELLLLPSEPFPFKQKHIEALQPLLPHTKIILADGEYFSWYGSRLLDAPVYFSRLQKKINH